MKPRQLLQLEVTIHPALVLMQATLHHRRPKILKKKQSTETKNCHRRTKAEENNNTENERTRRMKTTCLSDKVSIHLLFSARPKRSKSLGAFWLNSNARKLLYAANHQSNEQLLAKGFLLLTRVRLRRSFFSRAARVSRARMKEFHKTLLSSISLSIQLRRLEQPQSKRKWILLSLQPLHLSTHPLPNCLKLFLHVSFSSRTFFLFVLLTCFLCQMFVKSIGIFQVSEFWLFLPSFNPFLVPFLPPVHPRSIILLALLVSDSGNFSSLADAFKGKAASVSSSFSSSSSVS